MQFDKDIKSVVNRLVHAYGEKTVKALCNRLGVSVSVVANRMHRESFPHDLVLICALDTGANLVWLCTGQGEAGIDVDHQVKKEVVLSDDILEKLERLTALKEKGSITEQEFNLLKSNLI